MVNLIFHFKDFNWLASWTFFAACHGKSPCVCDGAGGTAKRCLTRDSLRCPTGNHILTAEDAFKFCKDSIHGIHFIFLNQQYVDEKRTFMQTKRNVLGDTIPGTQMFHHFFPIHIGVIAYKMTSEDPSFMDAETFSLQNRTVRSHPLCR